MEQLRIVRVESEERMEFAEEGISGALLGADDHASYTVGIVPPGGSQRHHRHSRPDDGTEVIFVYSGTFEVRSVGTAAVFDVERDGPILMVCPSGVPGSLRSLGQEVRFFSVFSPPFAMGEIEYLE